MENDGDMAGKDRAWPSGCRRDTGVGKVGGSRSWEPEAQSLGGNVGVDSTVCIRRLSKLIVRKAWLDCG